MSSNLKGKIASYTCVENKDTLDTMRFTFSIHTVKFESRLQFFDMVLFQPWEMRGVR